MVRRALVEKAPEVIEGFRMRGTEVSRLEAFADCVFGFGITLLVVNIDTPKDFAHLMIAMRGLVAFGLCFAVFYGVWSRHYTYCRRYGLEDAPVRFLTVVMLFVVLAYLYPLRFLTLVFVTGVLGIKNVGWTPAVGNDINANLGNLFIVYGVGVAAIQLVFSALYGHAYQQRDKLKLDEIEILDTRWWTREQLAYLLIPLLSISIVEFLPYRMIGLAGWIYFGMGFIGWIHGSMHGKRHRALVEKMEAEGRLSEDQLSTENDLVEVPPPA
ncbi:TMEM175 family protein [Fimbriimonas ginsengisoli]|uniref:Transglutaminase n=1 Tax=Fimbriimonas ginsengisoli Gsoil 348 TaxID=661478 RepID=A0A068NTR1_FIMGI|nr:TMEM175 family protein [Fimbriimonas ginsengisoli]AIE84989.1 Transglutaminase [Fimbriimonas ginsengisoli Gsoil 348]